MGKGHDKITVIISCELRQFFCQQLQYFSLVISIYIYSFYAMQMYFWYHWILSLSPQHLCFVIISLMNFANTSYLICRLTLVLICLYMSHSKFDVVIIIYVIYLFTVLSCLNFWIFFLNIIRISCTVALFAIWFQVNVFYAPDQDRIFRID